MTIDEFTRRLEQFEQQYPADASDTLEEGAKTMVKALRKESPGSRRKHPHKLRRSWKMKMVDRFGHQPKAEIRNSSPHYHLVERGVQNPKDPHGNPKPEWRDSLNRHKKFTENIVQEHWDDVKKGMAKEFYTKVRGHLG
jgi:hypothetical protein